ncbi:MAG TPA: hypothetical protein VMF90_21860 [Rhizobiaceae bacterium]|nr:hypothetical protein [Rhizobiaceae bacterium]
MICWAALLTMYLLGVWHWIGCPTSARSLLRPTADSATRAVLAVVWPVLLLVYFLVVLSRGILINAARLVGARKLIDRWL